MMRKQNMVIARSLVLSEIDGDDEDEEERVVVVVVVKVVLVFPPRVIVCDGTTSWMALDETTIGLLSPPRRSLLWEFIRRVSCG